MASAKDILVLGIETSCDDTAAAIVRRGADGAPEILANFVWTDHDDHQAYGGVVPEIAARSHVERIDITIEKALAEAKLGLDDLDAVAATAGPGLLGGVMVGLTTGKAISLARNLPFLPINHLEGHALSARMIERVDFPYLLLLISGGHTQLIDVLGLGQYHRLGTTIDDAAGEAFDKTAKLLDLGQPGGPLIETAAKNGRADRFKFPLPLAKRDGCDFSFSGMKTAVREAAEAIENPTRQDVDDIAASFQFAAARHLRVQTEKAMEQCDYTDASPRLVVAGGVAANSAIKQSLTAACKERGWRMIAPPPKFCTDNGAMIAWAGAEHFAAAGAPDQDEVLAMAPRARWPLAPPIEGREIGHGKKGPKA
ncbi:MAG: tRNA (adenosine(37)-N6)-threonylcarbamoyltransferase complex transferase subunit TsaD [Marinicaulis sp.]|nr:tRNA (adenosine(37)-N6)-threonylcarbamoyltransferase complex transferase subunit TsaD [Marinicaulis sp.]